MKPGRRGSGFLAGLHVVSTKFLVIDVGGFEDDGVGEIYDVFELYFNLIDGATDAWPYGLKRELVFGFSDYALSCEAGVNGGCARRVPAGTPYVFGFWRIVGEHVPKGPARPGADGCSLQLV